MEFQEIKVAIEDINQSNVPAIVDRIADRDALLGENIRNWCRLTDNNMAMDAARMFEDDLYPEGIIGYLPTDEEVEALIYMSNLIHMDLNYKKMLDASLYGQVEFTTVVGGGVITMSTWYDRCGNYPDLPEYGPSVFQADLDQFRKRRFINTIAHELGHIRYAYSNKVEYLRWKMMLSYFEADFNNNTDCYPNLNHHCASHKGHEIGNPDGTAACGAESIRPTEYLNGGRIFRIFH